MRDSSARSRRLTGRRNGQCQAQRHRFQPGLRERQLESHEPAGTDPREQEQAVIVTAHAAVAQSDTVEAFPCFPKQVDCVGIQEGRDCDRLVGAPHRLDDTIQRRNRVAAERGRQSAMGTGHHELFPGPVYL